MLVSLESSIFILTKIPSNSDVVSTSYAILINPYLSCGSLNINTEMGRFKIGQALVASLGNNVTMADYGQLELRLLASMTNCTSREVALEQVRPGTFPA